MASKDWGIEIPGGFFDEERHIYRNPKGTIVPSSTQVLEINGLSDFSMVKPSDLEWKRQYGNAVHAAVEYLVAGDLDWDSLDENIISPVTGIECRLGEMKFEVEATEERRIATIGGMEFGMTLDLQGTILHKNVSRKAVIDIKTGSKFSKTWEWQVGSYLVPQEKVPLGWIGVVIQVDPEGDVTPHYVSNVDAAKREFQVLLATAIIKLNNGFARIGG